MGRGAHLETDVITDASCAAPMTDTFAFCENHTEHQYIAH